MQSHCSFDRIQTEIILTIRAQMTQIARILHSVSILLFLSAYAPHSTANNLPDLGAPDLKDYDTQTETRLGQAFSTALHTQYDLVYDPISLSYIRRIGNKIVAETGAKRPFSFYIIDNPEINAFAGPNGVIGIHTGLIMAAKSEDELASVMAHEIAHVTQRHLSRTFDYQSNLSMTNIASIIAAILVGTQDPGAGIATYIGAMGINIQQQLKNSRIHENEADYFGIDYLNRSGYNPYAMGDFFERLSKEAQLYEGSAPEILMTHPVTTNRLAKAHDRAQQMETTNTGYQQNDLRLIQLRIPLVTKNTQSNHFNIQQLDKNEQCYLQNLSVLQSHKMDASKLNLLCTQKAINTSDNYRLFKLQAAAIKTEQKNQQAEKDYQYLEAVYPSDFSIPVLHAQSLDKLGKKSKAIQLLTSSTPHFHYQYLLYSELAKLMHQQQKKAYSYYYSALANYNIGNIPKTSYLLKQAKHLLTQKDTKLRAKIKQIESELKQPSKKQQDTQ